MFAKHTCVTYYFDLCIQGQTSVSLYDEQIYIINRVKYI